MRPDFCDAAERSEASYWPDASAMVDKPEDWITEFIANQSIMLPPTISRIWFNQVAAKVALDALREAARQGVVSKLFGEVEPMCVNTEMVARVLAELIDANNPRLQAKCLAFVLGLNIGGGKSQTQIASEEGVCKAAVSKRCVRLKKVFGLPPSRGMKSERAVESYRLRQLGKRARPKREKWIFSGLMSKIYAT